MQKSFVHIRNIYDYILHKEKPMQIIYVTHDFGSMYCSKILYLHTKYVITIMYHRISTYVNQVLMYKENHPQHRDVGARLES